MEVLVVLLVSLALLRVVGFLGVERLDSWRNAGLGALTIMLAAGHESGSSKLKSLPEGAATGPTGGFRGGLRDYGVAGRSVAWPAGVEE